VKGYTGKLLIEVPYNIDSYNLHPPLSHGVHYARIRVFSHLPTSIKSIVNETKVFKKTLKRFLRINDFILWMNFFNFKE
jgi:hypothetical protein